MGYVTLSRVYAQPAWTHNHTVSLTLTLSSGRSFSGATMIVPYTKHIKEQLCGIKILNRTLQQSRLMVPCCDTRSRGTGSNLDSVRDWLEVESETVLSFSLFLSLFCIQCLTNDLHHPCLKFSKSFPKSLSKQFQFLGIFNMRCKQNTVGLFTRSTVVLKVLNQTYIRMNGAEGLISGLGNIDHLSEIKYKIKNQVTSPTVNLDDEMYILSHGCTSYNAVLPS